jgi:hypothetical protein
MRTEEMSLEIHRLVTEVYNFATNPVSFSKWIGGKDNQVSGHDGPIEIGSTFSVQRAGSNSERRRMVYEVVALKPESHVAVRTTGRLLTYTAHRTFAEHGGSTTITERIEMEDPPGLARLLAGFMMGRVKKAHQQNLQELESSLEETAG